MVKKDQLTTNYVYLRHLRMASDRELELIGCRWRCCHLLGFGGRRFLRIWPFFNVEASWCIWQYFLQKARFLTQALFHTAIYKLKIDQRQQPVCGSSFFALIELRTSGIQRYNQDCVRIKKLYSNKMFGYDETYF